MPLLKRMNELEKQLLREAVGDTQPSLCLRTKTRVDAGRWGRKAPLWLCIVDGKLVLLSVARRMFIDCMPLSECIASQYCHATGELIIKPVEGLEFDHVAMTPGEALRVIDAIEQGVRGGREHVAFEG